MNIQIGKDKTSKFTREAQEELKQRMVKITEKVCEEAERLEAIRCGDISRIQITPRTVERAVDYVVEERVEKKKTHWFPAYICPFVETFSAIAFSYCIEHMNTSVWPSVISVSILIVALMSQLVYNHQFNK